MVRDYCPNHITPFQYLILSSSHSNRRFVRTSNHRYLRCSTYYRHRLSSEYFVSGFHCQSGRCIRDFHFHIPNLQNISHLGIPFAVFKPSMGLYSCPRSCPRYCVLLRRQSTEGDQSPHQAGEESRLKCRCVRRKCSARECVGWRGSIDEWVTGGSRTCSRCERDADGR